MKNDIHGNYSATAGNIAISSWTICVVLYAFTIHCTLPKNYSHCNYKIVIALPNDFKEFRSWCDFAVQLKITRSRNISSSRHDFTLQFQEVSSFFSNLQLISGLEATVIPEKASRTQVSQVRIANSRRSRVQILSDVKSTNSIWFGKYVLCEVFFRM